MWCTVVCLYTQSSNRLLLETCGLEQRSQGKTPTHLEDWPREREADEREVTSLDTSCITVGQACVEPLTREVVPAAPVQPSRWFRCAPGGASTHIKSAESDLTPQSKTVTAPVVRGPMPRCACRRQRYAGGMNVSQQQCPKRKGSSCSVWGCHHRHEPKGGHHRENGRSRCPVPLAKYQTGLGWL